MLNQQIVQYILECRRQGFDDWQIKEHLIKNSWSSDIVDEAFLYLAKQRENKTDKTKQKIKNALTIYLDDDLVKIIDKRAKKNMMNFNEQVEDILRRSCLSMKKQKSVFDKNLDDKFIALFSRKNTGRARKI